MFRCVHKAYMTEQKINMQKMWPGGIPVSDPDLFLMYLYDYAIS